MRAERAIALAILLAGCAHLRPIGEPRGTRFVSPAPVGHVRAVLLQALASSEFQPESERPDAIVARYSTSRVMVRIEARYDASGYAIAYVESSGIASDGGASIDARYHRWIDRLLERISLAFQTTPISPEHAASVSAVPVPPAYASAGGESPPIVTPVAPAPGEPGAPIIVQVPQPAAPIITPVTQPGAPVIVQVPQAAVAAPVAPSPVVDGPREPLWGLLGAGLGLLGASWIATWAPTIGVSDDGQMIGISFIPLAGSWAVLDYLRWDPPFDHPRGLGIWFPIAGLLQISGVIMTVIGAAIQIPVQSEGASATLTPFTTGDATGLALDATF